VVFTEKLRLEAILAVNHEIAIGVVNNTVAELFGDAPGVVTDTCGLLRINTTFTGILCQLLSARSRPVLVGQSLLQGMSVPVRAGCVVGTNPGSL
jgi:hypothetical protein